MNCLIGLLRINPREILGQAEYILKRATATLRALRSVIFGL